MDETPRDHGEWEEMLWVDPKSFKPEDYFTGGWLQGVQDYIALRK